MVEEVETAVNPKPTVQKLRGGFARRGAFIWAIHSVVGFSFS